MIWLAYGFFILGLFFLTFGVIGLIRFPDLYTRIHPAGKGGTAGGLSIFIGLMIYSGLSALTLRLALISLFILITSPVASHVIARGALESGIKPWQQKDKKQ